MNNRPVLSTTSEAESSEVEWIGGTNHLLSDYYEQRTTNIGAKRMSQIRRWRTYGGMNLLGNQKNPTQLFYCSPALLSRPWRGEPNYNTENRKSTTENRGSAELAEVKSLHICTRQMRTFNQKCKKIRAFCKFLKLTHLTPYTTKTYITFSPPKYGSRVTRDESRLMQNKPNFKHSAHGSRPTLNGSRATGHESRINMQNKPNFQAKTDISAYTTRAYGNTSIRLCRIQLNNK
jgi:hypothetical protein